MRILLSYLYLCEETYGPCRKKLTTNIATDKKNAGQASKGVVASSNTDVASAASSSAATTVASSSAAAASSTATATAAVTQTADNFKELECVAFFEGVKRKVD